MRDLANNIVASPAIASAAVGTTGIAGGQLSAAIDRKGYRSLTFAWQRGVSAAATDVVTPVVYEGDTTNGSFTSAANADLIGTEETIVGSAAGTKEIGYRGGKRYVKLRLYGTGTATSIVSAVVIKGHPAHAPA